MIASYEEDLFETWDRIAKICDWLGWADYDKLAKQIRFVDLKMFGPLWGVGQDTHLAIRAKLLEVGDWLLKECKDFGARLLMLDPSAGVYGANENARESVREFCSHLNGWGQDHESMCHSPDCSPEQGRRILRKHGLAGQLPCNVEDRG